MNTTKRRTFTLEFKQQAVELALANGDILQTARDLGIDQSNLRKWIRKFQQDGIHTFPGSGNPRDKELAELKKRLYNLEQENAILKKAVGIFVPRSR
jgi:transposase